MKEDNFIWTDKLACEFVSFMANPHRPLSDLSGLSQFKQSKSSTLPKSDTVVEDKGISLMEYFIKTGREKEAIEYYNSQVDAIREKTWYDARKLKTDENYSVSFFANYKSYLSSLNLNSNDTGKGERVSVCMSTINFDKQVLNPYSTYNSMHTAWEKGFLEAANKYCAPKTAQPTNDNAFVDEHFWEQELHKCKINPYYYATKYLTVNGKPFTTRLTETEFNDEFNRGIGNAQSAPEPSALPNKEYEILSFKNESGLWKCLADNVYGRCNGDGKYLTTNELLNQAAIHSVRRLSDNVVFSVGDNVLHRGNVVKREGIIESFRVLSGGTLFFKTNNYDVPLCYIATPKQPVVEDNVFTQPQQKEIQNIIFNQTGYKPKDKVDKGLRGLFTDEKYYNEYLDKLEKDK